MTDWKDVWFVRRGLSHRLTSKERIGVCCKAVEARQTLGCTGGGSGVVESRRALHCVKCINVALLLLVYFGTVYRKHLGSRLVLYINKDIYIHAVHTHALTYACIHVYDTYGTYVQKKELI